MSRKFHWYNFADARRLSALDERLERQAQQMGVSYPSSPSSPRSRTSDSVPKPEHSAKKIEKAREKAAQATEKDRCKVGKSCSAACIYRGDDCISLLEPPLQESVKEVRDMLKKYGVGEEEAVGFLTRFAKDSTKKREEDDSEDDSEVGLSKARIKEFKQALDDVRESCTKDGILDEKEYNKKLERVVTLAVAASMTDREKKAPASAEEIEAIESRRGMLEKYDQLSREVKKRVEEGNPMSPEELGDRLRPLAEGRRKPVSEEEVSLFIAMLPDSERSYLQKAGALDKKETGGMFGEDTSTDSLPEKYGPLKDQGQAYANNRLRMLARIYLAEDGRDFASGLRIPLTHADLEHTIAEETAGRAAEQGLNYSFLRTIHNVGRGNTPHIAWWDSRIKSQGYEFEKDGKLTPESKQKVLDNFNRIWGQINFKNEVETRASRAKNAAMLRELYQQAQQEEDSDFQKKLFAKIISFNLGTAETVGGGIQAHGRGEKRWYWLSKDTSGSEKVSTKILEKMLDLYERGDTAGIDRVRQALAGASSRVGKLVQAEVKPDPKDIDPSTGLPFVRVKGERTRLVREIVTRVRDQVLQEILAI